MTTTKATRYIAKCKCCNLVTSALVTPEEFRAAGDFDAFPKRRPMPTGPFVVIRGHQCLRCRGCGRAKYATSVSGKTTKHECNAKCLASTSGKCECSCGGKNHGASYAA